MESLKSILKSSGIYFSFTVFNKLIPFMLLPILTKHIDPSGFGVIAVVTSISTLAMPILGFCANSVLYQKFNSFEGSQLSDFFKASYQIIFFSLIFCSLVILAFSSQVIEWLKVGSSWLFIGILCAAFSMISTLTMSLFQLQRRPYIYGIMQTVNALINFITAIVMVVCLDLSWEGRIWALLISTFIFCVLTTILSCRYIQVSAAITQPNHVFSILRLGGLLMPSAISGWVIAMSDRMFLTTMTSLEVVGIYAIGVSIGQVTDIILASIAQGYMPYIYKNMKAGSNENAHAIVRSIYSVIGLSILVGAAVAVVGPVVVSMLVDEKYHDAKRVIPWISLSYVLFSIGAIFQALLLVEQKNHLTAYISLVLVACSVLANIYFIGIFQMMGAAIANTFTGLTFLVANFVLMLLYRPLPWFGKKIF